MTVGRARRNLRAVWLAGVWALAGAAAISSGAADLCAQASGLPSVPAPSPPHATRALVQVDTSAVTVGFALHVPAGSATDPVGEEGMAALLASALEADLAGRTAGLAVTARIHFDREGITVRASATPESVRPLVDAVRRSLFELPVAEYSLHDSKTALLARLRFEAGAPVRAFEVQTAQVFWAGFAGWDRSESGSVASVERIDIGSIASSPPFPADLRRRSTAALVGRIDSAGANGLLAELLGPDTPSAIDVPPEGGVPPRILAWDEEGRFTIHADITSTWVAIALPIDTRLAPWKRELLAHHLGEVLGPASDRAELVSPRTELVHPGGLPVLFVSFAVTPDLAEEWVGRVLSAARLETDAPPDDRFFGWERRRFRNNWLMAQARPDARAYRLARGQGVARDGSSAVPTGLGAVRTDLVEGARALGPPRVVVYGPGLGLPEPPDWHGLLGNR